jgi:hypothetical protein
LDRLAGSLTTTWEEEFDEGGAVVVTDERIPGLEATTVPPPPPKIRVGTSQTDPHWIEPGTTVVVPGAQADGAVP